MLLLIISSAGVLYTQLGGIGHKDERLFQLLLPLKPTEPNYSLIKT